MADGITVDDTELNRLAADLGAAPANIGPGLRKAVEVSARNVKDAWAGKLRGSKYVPRGPYTIDYDVKAAGGLGTSSIEAEIGPNRGRAASTLVGMLEVGTPHTGPRGFGLAALAETVEDFERGVGKAAEEALDGLL